MVVGCRAQCLNLTHNPEPGTNNPLKRVAADGHLGYNTRPPRDNGEGHGEFQSQTGRCCGQEAGCKEGCADEKTGGGQESACAQTAEGGQGTGAQEASRASTQGGNAFEIRQVGEKNCRAKSRRGEACAEESPCCWQIRSRQEADQTGADQADTHQAGSYQVRSGQIRPSGEIRHVRYAKNIQHIEKGKNG